MTDDAWTAPETTGPPSVVGVGILGILLGLFNLIGGGCVALGALAPSDSEVPDVPFYSPSQQRAIEEFVVASQSLDPVNAAFGALAGLVGVLLVIGGIVLLSPVSVKGLVGRVAFGASLVVDGLQLLWSVAWYALMWGALTEYVDAIAAGMPNRPPDFEAAVGVVTFVSIVVMLAVSAIYFGGKLGIAALGYTRATRADRSSSDPPPSAPAREPELSWATEEPLPTREEPQS